MGCGNTLHVSLCHNLSHTRWIVRWNGGSHQGEGRGEDVDGTLLSYTLRYISLTEVDIVSQVNVTITITDGPVSRCERGGRHVYSR